MQVLNKMWWNKLIIMQRIKKPGFTLIELLIVVSIVMLLSALTMMNIRSFRGLLVRTELEKLYATALYLQRVAQTTGQEQLLVIDVNHNTYVYQGQTEALPIGVQFGVSPGVLGPPGSPTHEITAATSFIHQRILFYPDGIIQSGTVYVTDGKRHTYALSNAVGHVSFLRKYRYDGSWQPLV